jgi:hypothetical protein
MPLVAEKCAGVSEIAPLDGMRARFLSRVAREGLGRNVGLVASAIPGDKQRLVIPIGKPVKGGREGLGTKIWRPDRASATRWPAAALAACTIIGIAGYYLGQRKASSVPRAVTQAENVTPRAPDSEILPDSVSHFAQQKAVLESQLVQAKDELAAARGQSTRLGEELAVANERLAVLSGQKQDDTKRLASENENEVKRIPLLEFEAERLRKQLADSQTALAVQELAAQEVQARLDATADELDRERSLNSAKGAAGDLVAARDLHIVDVYDADPAGKRQRAFGRVFYVEGKSLVFYAYDLGDPHRLNANVVFHVWGGKAGVKEAAHSLGILHSDDPSQARWKLTFDDASVLGQINSVFVTAEAANKNAGEPRGRKILYAYFGNPPNHS